MTNFVINMDGLVPIAVHVNTKNNFNWIIKEQYRNVSKKNHFFTLGGGMGILKLYYTVDMTRFRFLFTFTP